MTSLPPAPLPQQIQQACQQNLSAVALAFEECWREEVHFHGSELRPCELAALPTVPHYAVALEDAGLGLLALLPSENEAGNKLGLAAAHRIYTLAESLRVLLSPEATGWSELRVGLIENIVDRLRPIAPHRDLHRIDLRFRLQGRVIHVPLLAPLQSPCRLLARRVHRERRSPALLRIGFDATVVLASRRLPLQQLAQLRPGSLLEFGDAGLPASLHVDGTAIATGEAVAADDQFALRVQHVPRTQDAPRVARSPRVAGGSRADAPVVSKSEPA